MMLETRAIIIQTDSSFALVEATGASGCSVCDGKGCGSSKVGQMFCNKPRQFKVDNRINAAVGDEVIVSVAEGAVLRGVSLVYLLPLALLFAGALLAGGWGDDGHRDGYTALGALSGLLIGFAMARWISLRPARNQPYVERLYRE